MLIIISSSKTKIIFIAWRTFLILFVYIYYIYKLYKLYNIHAYIIFKYVTPFYFLFCFQIVLGDHIIFWILSVYDHDWGGGGSFPYRWHISKKHINYGSCLLPPTGTQAEKLRDLNTILAGTFRIIMRII